MLDTTPAGIGFSVMLGGSRITALRCGLAGASAPATKSPVWKRGTSCSRFSQRPDQYRYVPGSPAGCFFQNFYLCFYISLIPYATVQGVCGMESVRHTPKMQHQNTRYMRWFAGAVSGSVRVRGCHSSTTTNFGADYPPVSQACWFESRTIGGKGRPSSQLRW